MKIEFDAPMQFGCDPRGKSDRHPLDDSNQHQLTTPAFEIEGVRPGDYCELAAKENQELFQPIRPGGHYLEIAKGFRERADPAAVGYFILGRGIYGIRSYFQISQLQFEALAKQACIEMGYVGPRPVRFFLHKLATWKGELTNKHASTAWSKNANGGREHRVTFEIPEIFTMAALFCENELEWQARRTERDKVTSMVNNVAGTSPATIKTNRGLTPAQKRYVALYEAIKAVDAVKSDGSINLEAASLRRIRVELDKRKLDLPANDWCDDEDEQTWENACFTSKDKVKSYLSNIPNRIKTLTG